MQMGIPTIWNPSNKNINDKSSFLNREDLSISVKNLLVGTENDPHFK